MKFSMYFFFMYCALCFCTINVFGQNVGIGTPTPNYTLDVNGSLGINDTLFHSGDPDTWMAFPVPDTWELAMGGNRTVKTQFNELTINPDQSGVDLLVTGDGINTLLKTDASNDAIGIGTATPAHLLDIQGDMRVTGDGINTLLYADPTTNRVGIGTGTPDHLVDIQGGDVRVTGDGINALLFIDYDQNRIGVGTDTPEMNLDIAGGMSVDSLKLGSLGTTIKSIQSGSVNSPGGLFGAYAQNISFGPFDTPPNIVTTIVHLGGNIEHFTITISSLTNDSATINVKPIIGTVTNSPIKINWIAFE